MVSFIPLIISTFLAITFLIWNKFFFKTDFPDVFKKHYISFVLWIFYIPITLALLNQAINGGLIDSWWTYFFAGFIIPFILMPVITGCVYIKGNKLKFRMFCFQYSIKINSETRLYEWGFSIFIRNKLKSFFIVTTAEGWFGDTTKKNSLETHYLIYNRINDLIFKLFYFDDILADYEKNKDFYNSIKYLEQLFLKKKETLILNSILAFSCYYKSIDEKKENREYYKNVYEKYLDYGLKKYKRNHFAFYLVAGYYCLYYDYYMDKMEYKYKKIGCSLLDKASLSKNKLIKEISLDILIYNNDNNTDVYSINSDHYKQFFQSGSLLEKSILGKLSE